jgi:hypothetical protein
MIYSSGAINLVSVVEISSWSIRDGGGGGVVKRGGSTNASLDSQVLYYQKKI